jgi:hypothetical protein
MEKLSVKAVKGRVAFTAPRGGVRIPHDRYVEVDDNTWIRRLLDVHGDIIQEKKSAAKTTSKPTETTPASVVK